MKSVTVTEAQKKVLETLYKPYKHSKVHPQDAYNMRTLEALEKKNLVEFYDHPVYLHGAVRLTAEGKSFIDRTLLTPSL